MHPSSPRRRRTPALAALAASAALAVTACGSGTAAAPAAGTGPVTLTVSLFGTFGYQEAGLFAVGLSADGDATISAVDLADGPLVLVVGSEGRGLSRLVAQRCDVLARIPMPGPAESLNAGVAAGIALLTLIINFALIRVRRADLAGAQQLEPAAPADSAQPAATSAKTQTTGTTLDDDSRS